MTSRPGRDEPVRQYRACGAVLDSDIPFPELPPASGHAWEQGCRIVVRCLAKDEAGIDPDRWFTNWTLPTGEAWMSAARLPQGYLLRFHDWADFLLDGEGRRIVCLNAAGTAMETVRHLVLDHVLPLVFALQGRDVLHATAVLTPWGACAFVGPAGAGKSTLAASLMGKGYPLLSDDCLVLRESGGQVQAMPAYPQVRLRADSFAALYRSGHPSVQTMREPTGKHRIASHAAGADFPDLPQPLARIYFLARHAGADGTPSATPLMTRMTGRESFMALLAGSFRLDVTDKAMLARQFEFLARLPAMVPVLHFSIPDDFAVLPAVEEAILTDLRTAQRHTPSRQSGTLFGQATCMP